jgi:hypothetical protein
MVTDQIRPHAALERNSPELHPMDRGCCELSG